MKRRFLRMPSRVKNQPTRRAAKGVRKRQLIEATIESIAKHGMGDTTLARVSKAAGLSQGIVNLHFTSKDNLLTETLVFLRDEYEQAWRAALEKAPANNPAEQLAALMRADYQLAVADTRKLAVWFAFWGEVKSRPTYQEICQGRVTEYTKILEEIVGRLEVEGPYPDLDTHEIVEGIMAMADGLWLNILVSARKVKRKEAERVMMHYLAHALPKHADVFLKP
jgi:TetR/AcrR family transcriptional repressor of bet genes